MAIPAWIAITAPFRCHNNSTAPVSNAPPNNTAASTPNDPTPAATPRAGPRNASNNTASPAAPTPACANPATSGGRDIPRKCHSASTLPAATASVRTQNATETNGRYATTPRPRSRSMSAAE
jgi:hypothetical protein